MAITLESWLNPAPPQLLPKDLLRNARKISGEEAEKAIIDAVKNHSLYSHSIYSNQWMNPTAAVTSSPSWGTTSTVLAWTNPYLTTI